MSLYIIIAIAAYALFAANGVVDKFLLTKAVKHPVAYAFYIGITSPFTLLLAPFGLQLLGPYDILIAIAGGASFVLALYYNYVATQQTSISRILPIEGGLVPLFTLLFAYGFLDERLTAMQVLAFFFLVSGAVLISLKKDRTGWHPKALGNAVIAAVLFAISLTITKYIFDQSNFVSGLIWTRLGFFLASLCFLIPARNRKIIFNAPKQASKSNIILYYIARITGGVGGLMQNYAIALGSVTIVNAMQGTQYALLLVGTIILSRRFPQILKEQINRKILVQKFAAIILISTGLLFLAL